MTYWNTLAFKNAVVLGLAEPVDGKAKNRKDVVVVAPPKEQKDEAVRKLCEELGVTKPILKNVCFRNVAESVNAGDVLLFQLLKDEEARAALIPFIKLVADSKDVKLIPDIDVWEIMDSDETKIKNDGFEGLYENDEYVVKVQSQFKIDGNIKWPSGRAYMRIYKKMTHNAEDEE